MHNLIILFVFIFFINTSLCQAGSDKMTFFDLKFGMSIEEVKNITENFKHSFTKHSPSEGVVRCNSMLLKWGEQNPRWDYIFIDNNLSRVIVEVKQHPDVVMKKLEDIYGGYAQISYSIDNFKKRKTEHYIWKGKFNDLDDTIKKMKTVSYLKVKSVDFISKCDSYDIKYHKKGTGFVFPGILYYSVKSYDEKINTAKIKDKKQKEKMKEKQLQEQYDKLKL
ncbi:hypothetical protein ACQRCW_11030 [Desulfovibrio sp. SGI.082]|uniref:hypothetical protein n=1 Tax=unclassified Desulfovibrio TaxID=2593640 RepID=UPI003D00673F